MAELPRYRRDGLLSAVSPSFDSAALRQSARSSETLTRAMDRVSQMAFQAAGEQAKIEGIEYGAANAPTIQQLKEAQQRGESLENLLPGDTFSIFGQNARSAALDYINTSLQTQARKSISDLSLQFEQGSIDLPKMQESLATIEDTYSAIIQEFSPTESAKFRAQISLTGNSVYLAASKKQMAEAKRENDINLEMGVDEMINSVDAFVQAGHLKNDQGEIITVDNRLDVLRQEIEKFGNQTTPATKRGMLSRFDAKVKDAKTNAVVSQFSELETLEEKKAFAENFEEQTGFTFNPTDTRSIRKSFEAEIASEISANDAAFRELKKQIQGTTRSASTVLVQGGDPGEERVTAILLQAEMSGDPGIIKDAKDLVVLRSAILPMRKMPPIYLQNEINQMRQGIDGIGGEGVDSELETKIIESAEKLLTNIQSQAEKDPLSLGAELGHIRVEELDFSSPDALVASINARGKSALRVAGIYGVETKYLTDEEAAFLSGRLNKMTPIEKSGFAMAMQDAPNGLFAQLSGKGANVFAMAVAIGDSKISEQIFDGELRLKEKLVNVAVRADIIKYATEENIFSIYGAEDAATIVDASLAHYAATTTSPDAFDKSEFKDSLMAVTGGIGSVNGSYVELPRNVDEDKFESFMDRFPPELVDHFGGIRGASIDEAVEFIQRSKLKSIGTNRYIVLQESGAPVMREDGEPFVINFGDDTLLGFLNKPVIYGRKK
jgi:hypothetical protein